MQLSTAFCVLWLAWHALGNADDPKVFCYYNGAAMGKIGYERMDISEADPNLCTHMLYLSIDITADRNVSILRPHLDLPGNKGKAGFRKMNALRKRNERLKTLVSSGGQFADSVRYATVAANSSLRSKYVKNVVDFLLFHKFDGFDLRWEYWNSAEYNNSQNYVLLLEDFRKSFDEHKLILTVGIYGSEFRTANLYDIPGISKYVDFILLSMEYPLNEHIGHISPLYPSSKEVSPSDRSRNIIASIRYWLNHGASKEKLVLGTNFHGNDFRLDDSVKLERGPQAIARKGDFMYTTYGSPLSYTEICLLISSGGWTSEWDEEQHAPYSYSGDRWISHDNVRSLTEKAEYARAMGFGGVMAWTIDQDDHKGECGERFPLLKALNRGLRGNDSTSVSQSESLITVEADMTDDWSEDAKRTCARLNLRYLRHQQDCAKFWLCQKINDTVSNAKLFTCSDGLYFDADVNICKRNILMGCN